LAVVHRSHSGHVRQATPKMTASLAVRCRVIPAGQVTVLAAALTVKSSGGEPALDGGQQQPGLDHRLVPGGGDRSAQVRAP